MIVTINGKEYEVNGVTITKPLDRPHTHLWSIVYGGRFVFCRLCGISREIWRELEEKQPNVSDDDDRPIV